jgi:hypothetical protein
MHPYQTAIDFINNAGGNAKESQKPYRLLHKLAKAKGIYMHGSQVFIGKHFNLSPRKMSKIAKNALINYCSIGVLQIPDQFKYNDSRVYRHDGQATANRNTWKESNNATNDQFREEPVKYSLNTIS